MPYRREPTSAALQAFAVAFAVAASLTAGASLMFLAAYGAYALVNPCGR
jgi:hypothetical protein